LSKDYWIARASRDLIYFSVAMSALDTAKEIGRIASTASLGKDVIDLLEKKVALLTEQVTALETENANLKQKVYDLEQELDRLRPGQGGLEEGAEKILLILFSSLDPTPSLEQMASRLGVSKGIAQYHAARLVEDGMIELASAGRTGVIYILTPKGRAYVVENKLA
jgi:DNA-binding MarR family transcriptional regulator